MNIPANPNALKKSLEAETAYLEAERKRLMEEARQQEGPEVEETEQESAEARDADIDATIIMARAALLI